MKGRAWIVASEHSQVKFGAAISYILIILDALYGLFLTPYILGQVGEADYGVYKTISAFTASLMVMDLGLGGTMMRYIAKYRADKEEHKIPNFVAMGCVQTAVICGVVAVVTSVLYFFVDDIYSGGLSVAELAKAKQLFIFLALGMLAHIFQNFINGIISGYNKFIFANGIKLVRLFVRIGLIVVLLGIFKDTLALVLIDLFITVAFIIIELLYLFTKLHVKVKLVKWEKGVFAESFVYTILMFLTSLVAQANSNLSNIIVGAKISSTAVTIYSMAILIYGMYQHISTSISGVMLPTVTNSLSNDDEKYSRTVGLVSKVGRIQFLLLGAVFVGFVVLGRPFIQVWLGDGYSDVYYLTIILIGPALLELCINVCLSILRAKNLLGFRTVVITLSALLNLAIAFIGVRYIGYYACAIATSVSYFIGSVLVMGIYYYKKLGINLFELYRSIFSGIWLCIILSGAAGYAVSYLFDNALYKLLFGACAFVAVYAVTLLVFGLNNNEKNTIFSKVRRNKK